MKEWMCSSTDSYTRYYFDLIGVNGFTIRSLYSRGTRRRYLLRRNRGGSRDQSEPDGEEKNSYPCYEL